MICRFDLHRAYDYLKGRRLRLYAFTLLFLAVCLGALATSTIRADVQTMLPEGENGVLASDFERLSHSGLSNNVFISLRAKGEATPEDLIRAANGISRQLSAPHFTIGDPASVKPLRVIDFLLDNAPNLMDAKDLDRVDALLTPDLIHDKMTKNFRDLSSPQGIAMKSMIRRDPLGFRDILAPRLRTFSALSDAHVTNGHLFSTDQRALLLTAKSDIPLTDADGAAHLLDRFAQVQKDLPATVTAELIGGHVHTNANATTIKRDLLIISTAAIAALIVLFLLYFGSARAIGVFLAPLVAMGAALGAIALFCDSVSAIVIGFGSVLIGISIDFAMHVYFALARTPDKPGQTMHMISRPIVYCALTSCAAFGALFLSGMPGIRQLALFSIAGLTASAIFSLIVLPHLCQGAQVKQRPSRQGKTTRQHPKAVLILWSCVMVSCIASGYFVTIDPDLRSIEYMPQSVHETEQRFNATWGDMRSKSVVFAEGSDLSDVLLKNERTRDALARALPDVKVASLAPILPAPATQATNRARWQSLWSVESQQATRELVQTQGKNVGFSARAFLPFTRGLSAVPTPITPETLKQASLGFLVDMFMPPAPSGSHTMITVLPDSNEIQHFFSPEKEQELGVRLVSNSRFKSLLETTMKSDIKRFILISGLAVVLLVIALFRNMRRASLALLPAATGIAMVFGVLGLTETPLNLFHITALPLVIGLGADYGIFLVNKETQRTDLSTLAAVKVSGLTTLAGFGVLTLARHPSLYSLGITVLVGVGTALFVALYAMPHLLRRHP